MAAPWEKDVVVEEHADAPEQPSAPAAQDAPWENDRGQYGSGGAEDDGTSDVPLPGDVPEGATDVQRDTNGTLISYRDPKTNRVTIAVGGGQSPYDVAGVKQGGVASGLRGAADTLTFGAADEISAAAHAGMDAIEGGSFGESYDQHLKQIRDVMGADEADHPTARLAGQLLGGFANIPVGLESAGLRAGTEALRAGATMREARAIAAQAVTRRMAASGAVQGGAYGAGSGEDASERFLGAGAGALVGGATGLGLGRVAEAVQPSVAARAAAARAAPLTEAERTAAAADRQNIDLLPADVGGPMTRRLTSAAAQAAPSAGNVIRGAQRTVEQAQAVRDRVAASVGNVLNPEAAGQEGIRGARSFIARTSQRGNQLYTAAETGGNGVRIIPTQALGVLNRNIAELAETPGGSAALTHLEGLRDALSNGDFTVRGIRNMRTALRDQFTEAGLRGSDVERRVNQVVDAANEDVLAGLRNAGRPEAARAYAVADRYWRNRLRTIDENLAPIIGQEGEASGEEVVKRLTAASKGNNARLGGFINALPAEEQQNVRASLIGRLGRSTKSAQNDEGSAFSLQTFLSNWDDIGETARQRLFGPEGRAALNDLATVANGTRQAQGYANRSNTGGAIGNLLTGASGILGLKTLGTTVAAQYAAGRMLSSPTVARAFTEGVGAALNERLLASPRFVRWLARAPRTNLTHSAYLARLNKIARAEPAIAEDISNMHQRISDVLANGGSQSLAASPPESGENVQDTRAEVPQQKADDGSYQQWLKQYGIREDPTYDTRAAFEAGLKPDARGHLDDTYKQPNHPTFSDESVHNGEGGKVGGKWVDLGNDKWEFRASDWNLKNMSKQELKAYFDRVEPGTTVVFPDGERYTGKGQ